MGAGHNRATLEKNTAELQVVLQVAPQASVPTGASPLGLHLLPVMGRTAPDLLSGEEMPHSGGSRKSLVPPCHCLDVAHPWLPTRRPHTTSSFRDPYLTFQRP